ncbi:hypothetical protein LTV02_02060 [Nocardia yamanashiensis]|uniref:NACHT domain-containing protein n=1 Tax=Nocardia yamanashiensis TaxID=209247 RepID=UPI001E37257D|nr:NACHT domain-containing protein [Nocardia yamanashiensis]UGT42238.1 hypothetical protein LTV02_02060 [Nocardia yamanashiensis]
MTVLLFALLVGFLQLPGAGRGEVDPASLVVALTSLAVSGWFGWQSVRFSKQAQQWNDTEIPGLAERLANAVAAEELDARAELLGGTKLVDIDFRFRAAPAHNAESPDIGGVLTEVVAVYQRLRPQRLVITGAGGAGKTVLALELSLGLLASRAATDIVPVRISAPTWSPDQSIDDWLARYLSGNYGLGPIAARTLVRARKILPVIDGVDEMDFDEPGFSSRAARLLLALNGYQDLRGRAPVVITCRTEQLEALEGVRVWLLDAATIEIDPVSTMKAEAFLRDCVGDVGRWQPIFTKLHYQPTGALATALSTPWRLALARTVYERRDSESGVEEHHPPQLVSIASAGADHVRDHLLSLLIPTIAADAGTIRYRPEDVHRWLATLANDYLHRHGGTNVGGVSISNTDLILHRLWPLAGVIKTRLVTVCLAWLLMSAALAGELARAHADVLTPAAVVVISAATGAPLALITLLSFWTHSEPYRVSWPSPRQVGTQKTFRRFVKLSLLLSGGIAAAGYGVAALAGWSGVGWQLWAIPLCGVVFGVIALARDDAGVSARHPNELLAADLRSTLLLTAVSAAFMAVLVRTFPPPGAPAFGLFVGPALGALVACTLAPTSVRYLCLLLGTRRGSGKPLPWRLCAFMAWCQARGLLRAAGIAYQFRHREIQDYLIRNPVADS